MAPDPVLETVPSNLRFQIGQKYEEGLLHFEHLFDFFTLFDAFRLK